MKDTRFAPKNADRTPSHSLPFPPLFARQLELEKEMADRGRDRYYTTVARNTERNAEANTSYGKMLLKRGIEPMAQAISAFTESARQGGAGRRHKAVGMLEGMDVQVVAFIALRKVLDTFSQSMPYQRVSILVGREVEMEKKLTELKEQDPDRYRMTQRYIAGSKARKYRRTVLNYALSMLLLQADLSSRSSWPRRARRYRTKNHSEHPYISLNPPHPAGSGSSATRSTLP